MRYFFILLVLLSSLSYKGYSQQAPSEKFLKQINQAELAIVNNQAERAYTIYKKFGLKQLKLKDLNNFYLLALQKKEIEMGVQIAAEIAQRGVGSAYFKKSMFIPIKASRAFQEHIENADKYRALMTAKTKSFTDAIDSLYKVDQVIAASRTARYQGKEISLSILDSFDTNTAYLIELLKKQGFPAEGNIAPEIYQDTIVHFKKQYLMILAHCLQMSRKDSLKSVCSTLLMGALKENKIARYDFLYILNFVDLLTPESLGTEYFVYDPLAKKLWQSKYLDAERLKSVNKTRARYSIPPVHEDALKIKFRYSKPGYAFDTTIKTAFLSEKEAADLKEFQEIYFETNEFPK